MKDIKVTKSRRYDDACGTALALDLVGDRWALLVVRELMFGPRRFGELAASLRGISNKILAQRLDDLQAAGIVERRKLPSPASVQVYELTPWGYESEAAMQALGRWAVRSPAHDPALPLSAASLMISFRTMFNAPAAAALRARIGFRIGEEGFVATIDGDLAIARTNPAGADALLAAPDAMAVAAVVYGGAPMGAGGPVVVTGDLALARRFAGLFPLPPKAA